MKDLNATIRLDSMRPWKKNGSFACVMTSPDSNSLMTCSILVWRHSLRKAALMTKDCASWAMPSTRCTDAKRTAALQAVRSRVNPIFPGKDQKLISFERVSATSLELLNGRGVWRMKHHAWGGRMSQLGPLGTIMFMFAQSSGFRLAQHLMFSALDAQQLRSSGYLVNSWGLIDKAGRGRRSIFRCDWMHFSFDTMMLLSTTPMYYRPREGARCNASQRM